MKYERLNEADPGQIWDAPGFHSLDSGDFF